MCLCSFPNFSATSKLVVTGLPFTDLKTNSSIKNESAILANNIDEAIKKGEIQEVKSCGRG